MYENFYGLKEKPFSLLPDPEYLYLSEKHQMALTLLEYGILNQTGFCVISGQAGAGKTTLIRHLLSRFEDNISVGLLSNTHESFGELLTWILMSFDLDYAGKSKTQLYQVFVDYLIEQYAKNRYTVLIVDEAQNMSPETLEELRMLSNVNADKDQVLQVILVGQPGLLENLRRPDLEQFAQRIAVDYNLEALSAEETSSYIEHRLKVAGGKLSLFDDQARAAVYKHSGGIPRLINLLCDTALVYGYAEQAQCITARLVGDVVKERDQHGVLPKFLAADAEVASDSYRQSMGSTPSVGTAGDIEEKQQQQIEVPLVVTAASSQGTAVSMEPLKLVGGVDRSEAGSIALASENQAEQVARAMELNKQIQASSKIIKPDTSNGNRIKENDSIKQTEDLEAVDAAESARDTIIESSPDNLDEAASKEAVNTDAEGVSDTIADKEEESEHIGADYTDSQPIEWTDEQRTPPKNDIMPLHMQDLKPDSRFSFGVLGFALGLLLTVVVLVILLAKEGNPNSQELTTSNANDKSLGEAGQLELKALERERDAALAETRALQRERDAALAVAKAQEELNAARLKATNAQKSERLAEAKAARARAQAKSAKLEAELARQRELAAIAAEAAAQAKQTPTSRIVFPPPETEPPVSTAVPIPSASPVQAEQLREEVPAQEPEPSTVESEDEPTKFTPDPCKGPSAVFLSTCKK